MIVRAAERYETRQPGIVTRHCMSAGAHYDPSNLSFGPLLGVDEHVLDPGAEFAQHAHQGVEIISWIAEGTLHHRSGDVDSEINAGESLIQDAANRIEHIEGNNGDEPLRLIQTTLLADSGVRFTVVRAAAEFDTAWLHLYCCGVMQSRAGDAEMSGRMGTSSIDRMSNSKSGVLSWCPSCYVQFSETTVPAIERQRGTKPFEITPFLRYLRGRLDELRPHLRDPVKLRVALHRHSGIAGMVEAVLEMLQAVPGIEIVDLAQPSV